MSTRALQIRNAIATLLTTPALTDIGTGGVQHDPDYAWESRDLPAIAVYLGDETASHALIGAMDRQLIVTVKIVSKGSDPLTVGDSLVAAAYARITADLSLGGLALDIIPQGIRRSRDVIECPVAISELDFTIDYRTAITSLED